MKVKKSLPRHVVTYVNEVGVRSLDHLAANYEAPAPAEGAEAPAGPSAVQSLIEQWKSMAAEEKADFVQAVTTSVVEVIVASAALPLGVKLGARAVKSTRKVIKKKTKALRKAAKGDDVKPKKKVEKKVEKKKAKKK